MWNFVQLRLCVSSVRLIKTQLPGSVEALSVPNYIAMQGYGRYTGPGNHCCVPQRVVQFKKYGHKNVSPPDSYIFKL